MSRRADIARWWCRAVLLLGCGGSTAASRSWPPESLGGSPPDHGPTFDPQINPETDRLYSEGPRCDGPTRAVRARERVELNGGDYVDARRLALWEGSPRCELQAYFSGYQRPVVPGSRGPEALALQLDVRLADEVTACEGLGGGQIQAAATVWMQLSDEAGATLAEGACASALVSAWPAGTNLALKCLGLSLDLRAGWFEIRRDTSALQLPTYFEAQCQD